MTTPTAWAHLPNARLIDALIAALPTCPLAAWDAARDAARGAAWYAALNAAWYAARDAARGAALDAALDAARGAAWSAAWAAAEVAGALVAWDDMPAFIALSTPELEALRKVAKGTDVAHKALAAQIHNILTAHTR